MSGKIIYRVHKCVPPRIEPHWGPGTQWRCDCAKVWQILDMFGLDEWQTCEYAQLVQLIRQGFSDRKIRKLFPLHIKAKRTIWSEK